MQRARLKKTVITLTALLALSGCDLLQTAPPVISPQPRPAKPVAAKIPEPSDESRQQSAYFGRLQADLLAQDLLRQGGGGPDAPFDARNLADNFIRIALFDEYVQVGGTLVARATPSRLRRWEKPIRMEIEFGETVPLAQRKKDIASIANYTRRLSRLTGVPIRITKKDPNFHVLILNEDERRKIGPHIRAVVPGIGNQAVDTIVNMPRDTLCLVYAFPESEGKDSYGQAIAVIRGEHPDLLRLSCFHEELAQGMGLANDSPNARPSIFNDDEEFGLLTTQDEMMLKMLYDKRLTPGMTPAQARPIVEQIAKELMGGSV